MTEIISSFTGDHDFLSNFHMGPGAFSVMTLGYGGAFARSGEHAYQAFKAADPAMQAEILNAGTPLLAKRLGRAVVPLPEWWEHRKKIIMLDVLMAKFSAPWYRDRLLATGTAVLVEGNTWGDDYWGAVQGGKPPIWHWGKGWYGHNWLGRELMMVREVIA